MRPRVLFITYLLIVSVAASGAQTAKDAETFRSQVVGKRFFVIGFSADPIVKFEWNGDGVTMAPSKVKTLGALRVTDAKVKDNHVDISGQRSTLIIDDKGQYSLSGETPAVLSIDLKGSDPTTVFPKLKDYLFFTTIATAVDAIPDTYKSFLPDGIPRAKVDSLCAPGSGSLGMPKLVFQPDAEFPEEARIKKISGSVDMILTVDEQGRPINLWIGRPAGSGLDEQAVKAVSEYKFKPATCGATAIQFPVAINVKFSFAH